MCEQYEKRWLWRFVGYWTLHWCIYTEWNRDQHRNWDWDQTNHQLKVKTNLQWMGAERRHRTPHCSVQRAVRFLPSVVAAVAVVVARRIRCFRPVLPSPHTRWHHSRSAPPSHQCCHLFVNVDYQHLIKVWYRTQIWFIFTFYTFGSSVSGGRNHTKALFTRTDTEIRPVLTLYQ